MDGNAPDYRRLREVAANLIEGRAIDEIITATYSRLLVDEYQDCSARQHRLVTELARLLPTCVFGDPLQAVFDFDRFDPLTAWPEVENAFALVGELNVPHRWENVGAQDLGRWLLQIRAELLQRRRIDLRLGGQRVQWRQLTGNADADIRAQVEAQRQVEREPGETLLIIGDSRNVVSRHEYARHAEGVNVVEPVELRGMIDWAQRMNGVRGATLFDQIMAFAREVMVNLEAGQLRQRLEVIQRGRNRRAPSTEEAAALTLLNDGSYGEAEALLSALVADRNRRVFRRGLFTPMMSALALAASRPEADLVVAAASVRDQGRFAGRRLPTKAVGSTLLLKGLESDHALILNADQMSAAHLYVALSRGSRSVTVFSSNPVLP